MGIYTPKISNRFVHVWDINTCFEIAMISLNVYPPNQIPGYATDDLLMTSAITGCGDWLNSNPD